MKLQCENHWSGISQLGIRHALNNYMQMMGGKKKEGYIQVLCYKQDKSTY